MSDLSVTKSQRSVAAAPSRMRAHVTNDPIRARCNRRTAEGRRRADLFRAYMAALGNPPDALSQTNALCAAELKQAAEDARARLLAGAGNANEVVRLENLASRAERKLGLKAGAKPKPILPLDAWKARQAEKAAGGVE
jgi:hypothetical protein